MADMQTIREVSAAYKQLDPINKAYVSGIMRGVLLEKEQQRERDRPEENRAS